jgi:uncharacterized protein (DUF2236 family)
MALIETRRPLLRRGKKSDDGMMGIGLLAGPANVIMQLARPGVGYGVLESRTESGRADLHPIKRARTTFTYLAVSIQGTPEQKAAFRRAVNRAHAQVHSTDESAVSYNAFEPDLQMWVGACMYKGIIDIYRTFVGEMDDEAAERVFREGIALGTMLQVPEEMWPADRAAFEGYWEESLAKVHIDDSVREYLYPIAVSRVRGGETAWPTGALVGKLRAADHDGLSTATLPGRDAAGVEPEETTAVRPADGRASNGGQSAATLHPGVSLQRVAEEP